MSRKVKATRVRQECGCARSRLCAVRGKARRRVIRRSLLKKKASEEKYAENDGERNDENFDEAHGNNALSIEVTKVRMMTGALYKGAKIVVNAMCIEETRHGIWCVSCGRDARV